jgi:hypothetical protein
MIRKSFTAVLTLALLAGPLSSVVQAQEYRIGQFRGQRCTEFHGIPLLADDMGGSNDHPIWCWFLLTEGHALASERFGGLRHP